MADAPKYHLRRVEKEITEWAEIEGLLKECKYTTLGLCRDGEPYVVTLSYGYDAKRRALYLHCASAGLKLEFIKANPEVCGTIIKDLGYVVGKCKHDYRSIVYRGKVSIAAEREEAIHGMRVLAEHLEPEPAPVIARLPKADANMPTVVLRIDFTEIQAKRGL